MHYALAISILAGFGAAQNLDPKTPIKASFTEYGSNDTFGSGNCQTNTVACGFYTTGPNNYYAAISQNYYGCGPGGGACHGCEKCWMLNPQTDSSGNKLNGANSIVVKINNLCPAQGNPLCSQQGTDGTNQYGANVNIDTCIDSGASQALFGTSGVGLALGTAYEVDCSLWGTSQGSGSSGTSTLASSPVQTAYGQCGGQGWSGDTSCPSGYFCQAQNTYYSQCVPGSGSGSSAGPVSSTAPSSATQTAYGQCGGQGWTGPTTCPGGTTCQYQNTYYSQCLSSSKKLRFVRDRVFGI